MMFKYAFKYFAFFLSCFFLFLVGIIIFERYDFQHYKNPSPHLNETIKIHFIHGSEPKPNCIYAKKRLGGLWGGHVEVEIDSLIYGFQNQTKDVTFFATLNSKKFNSEFTVKTIANWEKESKYEKITSVILPVSKEQKNGVLTQYNRYVSILPYDYAFLGMRCTASIYEVLGDNNIIENESRFKSILLAFYPAQFRNKLIAYANKNNMLVEKQKGVDCRIWE